MPYSLTWLPDVLRNAGLRVAEVNGWRERGHREMPQPMGVMCHTTVGARSGNMPSLGVLIDGRPDLKGPLSQLGLGRDGSYYVIAAGLCHHAGAGEWRGLRDGNSQFIGIEAENSGGPDDFWPDVQIRAYQQGVAALLQHLGRGAEFCAGHKEYARPLGRKSDPDFSARGLSMDGFRAEVQALLGGGVPALPPIPGHEPGGQQRATLRRGSRGPEVGLVQRKLRLRVDDDFGPRTEAATREIQRVHGLVPDGIVGPKTWALLDAL